MAIIEVDETNFNAVKEEELSKGNIIIVKFGSEYCDQCHALGFELDELAERNDNISILIVDCEESSSIAEHFDIYRLPTMIIYKDADTMLYRGEGVLLYQDIEEIIVNG